MRKKFTLGKKERLKSRKQIEQLFSEGKSFVLAPFRVYFIVNGQLFPDSYREVNRGNYLQFGAGVSGKFFKKAVDRNRIKRMTREAWRLQKNILNEKLKTLEKQLNVFFIYTGKEIPDFTLVKSKVAVALKKLSAKIDESNSPDS